MLQQTQVSRVIPKYRQFLARFPTVATVTAAPLAEVMQTWQGLGYNRRAKYLWLACRELGDVAAFPQTVQALTRLPGIGPNTAGAIVVYAFNRPAAFIETNIRTVYIHHFFRGWIDITDKSILSLVAQTLDTENPREWYWALMDYGSHLKSSVGNLNRAGKSYAKQSKFHGSRRQLRGQVLRELAGGAVDREVLLQQVNDMRLPGVLNELAAERLIYLDGQYYRLGMLQ